MCPISIRAQPSTRARTTTSIHQSLTTGLSSPAGWRLSWTRLTARRTAMRSVTWTPRSVSWVYPWTMARMVQAGTSSGPWGLREASSQYFSYMFEYDVDLTTFFRPVDCGDVPVVPGNNDRSHKYIYDYVTECLEDDAKVILCGGDHSVPISGAMALSDFQKDGKIGYLHIDCNLDSAPDWGGIRNTNCSGPSRAFEFPNCDGTNMAHMGSRNGLNPKDWVDFYVDNEVRIIPMYEVVERSVVACTKEIFDIAWNGTDSVYFRGIPIHLMPAACQAPLPRKALASRRARRSSWPGSRAPTAQIFWISQSFARSSTSAR